MTCRALAEPGLLCFCRCQGRLLNLFTELWLHVNMDLSGALGLRRAFRQAVIAVHPDKGGTTAEFSLLQLARHVLVDRDLRAAYDAQLDDSSSDVAELTCPEADGNVLDVVQAAVSMLDWAIGKTSVNDALRQAGCKALSEACTYAADGADITLN